MMTVTLLCFVKGLFLLVVCENLSNSATPSLLLSKSPLSFCNINKIGVVVILTCKCDLLFCVGSVVRCCYALRFTLVVVQILRNCFDVTQAASLGLL